MVHLVGVLVDEGLVEEAVRPILPSIIAQPRSHELHHPKDVSILCNVPVELGGSALSRPDADGNKDSAYDDAHNRPEALGRE